MTHLGNRVAGRRAHGGVLLIPCLLQGAYRYWFLADTGAARTILTPQVAEEIDLDLSQPLRQERIASVHRVAWAPVLRLGLLQIGAQQIRNLEVLVIALPGELHIDGILGVDVLGRFHVTFEFDRGALVLR